MALVPQIEPVTPERWDDLVAVMSTCSYGRKCWCAYWYLPNKDFKAGWGDENRAVLERLVKDGEMPGLIAYVEGKPAAWVGVAPRTRFDRLNRSKTFVPLDDLPVYAVNCFVVAKPFRRQGLMVPLAKAAADFAFSRGAPGVESYPVDASARPAAFDLYLGTSKAFRAAGYVEVARPLPRRPVMRKMRD
jgi:GNAT superfamily N-acetyltransferase